MPRPRKDAVIRPTQVHPAWAMLAALVLTACAPPPRPSAIGRPVPVPPTSPATINTPARTASTTHAVATPAPPTRRVAVAPGTDARSHLARTIDAFIGRPRFRHARWGIAVRDLDSGRTLYSHQADKLFIPASNAKLYIAALALDTLGADFRLHTSLYATRHPDGRGVLHGDLVLYGRGDPGLGVGKDGKPDTTWATRLAAALAQRGIRRVTGNLIADDTWYQGPPYGAGWEIDDQLGGYAPPVSALSVQDNAFTLRVGGNGHCCTLEVDPAAAGIDIVDTLARNTDGRFDPLGLYRPPGSKRLYVFGSRAPTARPRVFTLAAPDPARMAGALLAEALARRGIDLDGHVEVRHWPDTTAPSRRDRMLRISDVRSVPLHALVRHMLKTSDNLYAQLLLLAVGKRQAATGICEDQPHPPTLTAGWGLCALRAWLRGIGIDTADTQFEEGSGLSRKDRVTPDATVHLLAWIARQPFAAELRDALPVAGVDGTLEQRLRGTPAAGNLRAKTGTLHMAYTLSGYVHAANGDRLAFSIMLNGYAVADDPGRMPPTDPPTRDVDTVARLVTGYGQVPLEAPATPSVSATPAPAARTRNPGAATGTGTTPAPRDPPPG